MTRREYLLEQYEDALFALLMDEVAVTEGEKQLEENRRLRDGHGQTVSPAAHQRCRRAMSRKAGQRELEQFGRGFTRVMTKVAVVALLVMVLFTTAFAVWEGFRAKALNVVTNMFHDHTEIRLVPSDFEENLKVTAAWLPEGFTLVDEGATWQSVWCVYNSNSADGDASVAVVLSRASGGGLDVDTEEAEVSALKIQGQEALLVEKGQVLQVVWQCSTHPEWLCQVVGRQVSAEQVIRVAESVTVG